MVLKIIARVQIRNYVVHNGVRRAEETRRNEHHMTTID